MYELKKVIIACVISLVLGAVGASAVYIAIGNSDNRRLDTELRASRADYQSLELEYRTIEQSNIVLGERLQRLSIGVTEAKRLAGQLSVQGEAASTTIRRVIENLRKIKEILAATD